MCWIWYVFFLIHSDFIFKNLFHLVRPQKFSLKGFIECLIHLVINNKISKIPPSILILMKRKVLFNLDHLFDSHQYGLFEKCFMKLDITGLDLTEVFYFNVSFWTVVGNINYTIVFFIYFRMVWMTVLLRLRYVLLLYFLKIMKTKVILQLKNLSLKYLNLNNKLIETV